METGSVQAVGTTTRRVLYVSLGLLILAGAVIHIGAVYSGDRTMVYVSKPATMLAIIALAAVRGSEARSKYALLVLVALVCSLAGDILLMLPADLFIAGLVSFLVAHIFYIGAFRVGLKGWTPYWMAPLFYVVGAILYWRLLPGLGDLKVPVAVYMVVILTMAWQSVARWSIRREGKALFAVAGAVLFVVSDAMIAFSRFNGPFELAEVLIMVTYFAAQSLIALSV